MSISNELIIAAITMFGGSGIIGYFLGGRTKQKSDFLTNVQEIYDRLAKDQKEKLAEYQFVISKLETSHKETNKKLVDIEKAYEKEATIAKTWEKTNREQKTEIEKLLRLNKTLTDENKRVLKMNQQLVAENKKLSADNKALRGEIQEIKEAFEQHKLSTGSLL